MGIEEKLKAAGDNYRSGCTCAQAVFCAYADELGLDRETASRLMEGFGGGCGGMQEVCGALSAAFAVVSWHVSGGTMDGTTKARTYQKIRETADIFKREYSGVTCRDVLKGRTPQPFQCGMKVKDAVLIIEQVLAEEHGGQKAV